MKRLVFAVAAVLLSTTAQAQAQASTAVSPLNYAQVRAGLYMPQGDEVDQLEIGTGLGFDAVFGRRLHPNVAGELGIGWYTGSEGEVDLGFGSSLKSNVSIMPITASARLIAPLGQLEPYGLVGVGLYRATLSAEFTDSEFGTMDGDESATAFGLQLGAGATFKVSPNAYLGAELRYVSAKPQFDDGEGGELEIDVSGILLNAAVGFQF